MSEPLTAEQARELARRWVAAKDAPDVVVLVTNILNDAERARLFAWVRERMAQLVAEADAPGQSQTATMRHWLAMRVGCDLGLGGNVGPADALCEAAGWPS